MDWDEATFTAPDGRLLEVCLVGEPGAPLVVNLPGTPEGIVPLPQVREAVRRAGLRMASIARPGYGRSTRSAGRTVASVVPDVLVVADAVGATRFVAVGDSGGGPHALACAALAPDRCLSAASISGIGPFDSDLDAMAGMGEDNIVELGAAQAGEGALRPLLEEQRQAILAAEAATIVADMASLLTGPDLALFAADSPVGGHFVASFKRALAQGVDGWLDDDLAFVAPWGFEVAAITVPVSVWQGHQDLMVPPAHGEWLAANVPTAIAHLLPAEGHLTTWVRHADEILAELTGPLLGGRAGL